MFSHHSKTPLLHHSRVSSSLPHQLRHRHGANDVFDAITALLRFGLDGVEVVLVVKGEGTAEGVGAEVLDEGAGDFVAVF